MHRIASLAVAAWVVVVMSACSGHSPNASGGGSAKSVTNDASTVSQPFVSTAEVLDAVKAAQNVTTVPDPVAANLSKEDNVPPKEYFDCKTVAPADNPTNANPFGQCAYGNKNGSKLMVIYGDSRAPMWTTALAAIAAKSGWKVRAFSEGGCPVPYLHVMSYQTNSPDTKCDTFRDSAIPAIQALHPDLVVMSSISDQKLADGNVPSPQQWQDGWATTFAKLLQPGTKYAVLGDIPVWKNNDARCLAANLQSVQDCSAPVESATPKNIAAEQAASAAAGALYIPTTQWICTDRCEPLIAGKRVYNDEYHLASSYVLYLSGAIADALNPVTT
jgi:hypothetical protein